MENNTTKEKVLELLGELIELLQRDFIRDPEEVDISFADFINAGLTRCTVMRDELGIRFSKIETLLRENPSGMNPEKATELVEVLGRIKGEIEKAQTHFEKALEEERKHPTKGDYLPIAKILYGFAEERRKRFREEIERVTASIT